MVLFLRGHPRKQLDYLITRLLLIKFAHLKVFDLNFNVFLFLGLSLPFCRGYHFSGTISFCVCYYRGPVTSDRGLDLIRWMLQFIGLTLLYMGTRSDVVSFGLITVVLFSHVIRSSGILMKIFPKTW